MASENQTSVTRLQVPIALALSLFIQGGAFIWWTAQQDSTIKQLEIAVSALTTKAAAEEQFNLKRDVADLKINMIELDTTVEEIEDALEVTERKVVLLGDLVDIIDGDVSAIYGAVYSSTE